MERLAEFTWRTPAPTSINEQLVVYDDGTAWLVVRTPRSAVPTIGSYSCRPGQEDLEQIVAAGPGPHVIDILASEQPLAGLLPVLDRVCGEARETPVAIATFHGRCVGTLAEGEADVGLLVVAGGERAVEFELNPDWCGVHYHASGATVAWYELPKLETGFVTQDAKGLGGLKRIAVVEPAAFGAISFRARVPEDADSLVVQVGGWLSQALPHDDTPERFEIRTDATPLEP